MYRECPVCAERSIRKSELLFSDTRCPACKSMVGVSRFSALIFSVFVSVVTAVSCIVVWLQMGMLAAVLWFPFPVGSLNYVKASLIPLHRKSDIGAAD